MNSTRILRKAAGFGLFQGALTGAVAGVLAMVLALDEATGLYVGLGVGLVAAVLSARYVVVNERARGFLWEQRQAEQWIAAGRTAPEKARRQKVWDETGYAGVKLALGAAGAAVASWKVDDDLFGSEPAVNVDGSPMFGGVDCHGNPYGVVYNPAADALTADGGVYESPLYKD